MKRTMLMLALVTAAVAAAGGSGTAVAKSAFPETIALPNGFQPEGIAIGGNTFYVGSIPTGAIYRGNLRTGQGGILVPGSPVPNTKAAIGLSLDRGRLWVAGGATGKGYVYSASTGQELATFQLTTASTSFVNDVVVTRTAAWFTDSFNQFLYRVPVGPGGQPGTQAQVQAIPLTGAISFVTTPSPFNVNGIDATPNGKTLVIVQSNTGKLFTVTPQGVATEISLGGANVMRGDGILLDGRTLYVVQNQDNKIAVVKLDARLGSGRIVGYITDSDFRVPTTVAEHGNRLYLPNARFGTPPTPTTDYNVVQVKKNQLKKQ